jgi:hypothetical protein
MPVANALGSPPPSAILQYREMLPSSTGWTAEPAGGQTGSHVSLSQSAARALVANASRPNAAALRHLVESSAPRRAAPAATGAKQSRSATGRVIAVPNPSFAGALTSSPGTVAFLLVLIAVILGLTFVVFRSRNTAHAEQPPGAS